MQLTRKRIPAFTAEQAEQACKNLIANQTINNATKFVVVYKGQPLPPKKVIIEAVRIATGLELSVREFSGGEESNRPLRKAGLTIQLLSDL